MKNAVYYVLICLAAMAFSEAVWANKAPEMSNVQAEQRSGTSLVDITYDVNDPDGDLMMISVQVSNDAGRTYTIFPETLSGDMGEGIASGAGKQIVWDAGKDIPGMWSPLFKIRVTADDGTGPAPPSGMVLVPAGEFIMGSDVGESREKPEHTIFVDVFYIDQYEVTYRQWKEFLDLSRLSVSAGAGAGDNYPVTNVTWSDARAYCEWMGNRLPTEAEWEKAVRGSGGQKYPWGNLEPGEGGVYRANILGSEDAYSNTSPVGSFPEGVSPYGAYDMAGNVWEWCADWYSDGYYSQSPEKNPTGPETGVYRVLRGGSWNTVADYARSAIRAYGDPVVRSHDYGFRCVREP